MRVSRSAAAAFITLSTLATASAVPAFASEPVAPVPAVTALSVHSGPSVGGTAITVTGTELGGAKSVTVGGVVAKFAIAVDGGHVYLKVTSPAHDAGVTDLRVVSTRGTSAVTSADKFTYVAPAPTVTHLSPSTGTTLGGTTVTVTGTNFVGVSAVKIGDVVVKATVTSSTSLHFVTPKHAAGVTKVVVATTSGIAPASDANTFTFVAPAPTTTTTTTTTRK